VRKLAASEQKKSRNQESSRVRVSLSLSLARCAAHSAAIKKVFSGACSENLASGEQSLIRQFGVSTHLVTDIFEDARAPLSPLYSALRACDPFFGVYSLGPLTLSLDFITSCDAVD
jgi:hypothetical protein